MIKFIRSKGMLFTTALFQVFFVAMQPLLIINHKVWLILICGFTISLIWSFNIKKVCFGNMADRFVYATGAMIGTGLGYYTSSLLITWL